MAICTTILGASITPISQMRKQMLQGSALQTQGTCVEKVKVGGV